MATVYVPGSVVSWVADDACKMNKETRRKMRSTLETMRPGDRLYLPCDCQPTHRASIQLTRYEKTGFAYCHRCKQGVEWKETYINQRDKKENTPVQKSRKVPDCKLVGTNIIAEWPPVFRTWAKMITQDEASRYGIEYVPSENELKLPTITG